MREKKKHDIFKKKRSVSRKIRAEYGGEEKRKIKKENKKRNDYGEERQEGNDGNKE